MQSDETIRILLVDDEPANLLALEAILEQLGAHLVRAQSGEDAITRAEDQEFAVILLDVQMPGLDGYETARILRSRPLTQFTPIIFLTAFDCDAAAQARAYGLGAVDFLVKPLNSFVLKAKVQVFVDLFRKSERIKQLEKEQFRQRLLEEKRGWEQTTHLVSRIFAESTSEPLAITKVLQAVCQKLKCDAAALWSLDNGWLRCKEFWQSPGNLFPEFEAASRVTRFGRGIGLPGRVWELRELAWLEDFQQELDFPRLQTAQLEGIITAVGFPLLMGQEFLGVIEFFSRRELKHDDNLMQILREMGAQIGPFLHRMQSAKALARSESLKSAMLNAALDCIVTIDEKGNIVEWNPAAEKTFGYTFDEAIGRQVSDLIVPHYLRDAHKKGMADYFATGLGPALGKLIELPAICSDGREIRVELAISPIRLGSETLFTSYIREITERKQAERAILESEGRLQLAVEIAEMGTFEIDVDSDKVTVNDPGRVIYGWPSNHTTFTQVQSHFHPEDRERVLQQVGDALRPGGTGTFDVEQRIYRTDGELRWIRVRGRGFFDGQGESKKATRCVGTYIDITERKQAEEAMKEADRRKDEFLAILAHELRNPLAPLRNGLQVMRLAADSEDAIVQTRQMMDRQLTHMVRIVDDLLDLSRITRNKLELRPTRILFSDIIANAVETAAPAIKAGGHELLISLPTEPVFLEADLTRLAQVFANLLTNAAKYTDNGGRIWLTATRHDYEIIVEIKDTGIGIPPDALPNLFEMFSQVDRSLERTREGLGIGLALVKRLLEMHRGEIVAHSDGIGQGSCFTVKLPVLSKSHERLSTRDDEDRTAPSHAKRRILVVDDNKDSARSMALLLQALGNEVTMAHDGLEAVSTAATFRPSVILMDIGMPKLNGFDATRRIREYAWGRNIAVIALTGWGQDSDRQQSREAGCDAHLVKPADLTALQGLIERLAVDS